MSNLKPKRPTAHEEPFLEPSMTENAGHTVEDDQLLTPDAGQSSETVLVEPSQAGPDTQLQSTERVEREQDDQVEVDPD